MGNFIEWVKKHPVLSGTFFVGTLILLYVATRGSSSSGTSTASSSPATNPSLQALSIQTGAALQAAQLSANTDLQKTAASIAAQLQIAEINATTQKQTIEGQVTLATSQLQAQENEAAINADLQKTAITSQQAVTTSQIEAARDQQLATDAIFTHQIDTSAATQQLAISTAGMVSTVQASVADDIYSRQIDAGVAKDAAIIGLIKSGQLNKGGEGGSYQIQALGSITNPAVAETAAQTYTASASNNPLNSLLRFGSNIVTGLF